MHRALALACLLAGCDYVFSLDRPAGACWNPALVDDEDADGVANGCDYCPAFANAGAADTDGDGVLDPCDPDPAAQTIVDFSGFTVDGDAEGWEGVTWAVHDGAFVQHDPTVLRTARKEISPTTYATIEAPIAFQGQVNGSFASIGVRLLSVSVTCRYEFADGSDMIVLDYGGVPLLGRYDAAPGMRLRLGQTADGAFQCQVIDVTGGSPILASPPLSEMRTSVVQLETNQVIAAFSWVMVVGAESP